MYFKVKKSVLLEKLQLVASILPQRTTLIVLGNIKIQAAKKSVTLSATDLDISLDSTLTADIVEEGSITVPGRRFLETVRDLPPCEIEIKVVNDFVELRYNKGTYKMPAIPIDEYPEIPKLSGKKHFSFPAAFLRKAVLKTSFAASKEPGRRALSGIHWHIVDNESNMIATDGRKLAYYRCTVKKTEPFKLNIPPKALRTLIGYIDDDNEDIDIRFDDTKIGFYLKDTTIIARLIEEVFPDYKQVIPKGNKKTLKVPREELMNALKRVAIYADSISHLVRFDIEPERVRVYTETELGSGEEYITGTFNDKSITVNFNASYLAEILRNVDDDSVEFLMSSPKTAVIITHKTGEKEELMYLLMPIITS
ncbi:MAG: DNA polymerase III subunit beta [Candidatus Cloacimonadota bacterium]|jgi:DNA polymerase-3 subunit beta|nr:MAG: DNA polymerase III subunit beta [Candidatus Cloacimonadota bacterium]